MKIWRITGKPDKFRKLVFNDGFDLSKFLDSFDGIKKGNKWNSPEMKFLEEDKDRAIGDFTPFTSGVLFVKNWVANKLKEYFGDAIEVLGIKSMEGFSIIHIIDVCECVDYKNSIIDYYPDKKRIMFIDKYVFKVDVVFSKTIFKDSGFPTTEVFVTDKCKQQIESWNATGVKFEEYWDSEDK